MVALSRNLSRKAAMRMLLTAEMIEAEDARTLGLVSHVAEPGSALSAAQDLAGGIAARSPDTVRVGKRAFYAQIEMPLADAYAHAGRVMAENMLARRRRRASVRPQGGGHRAFHRDSLARSDRSGAPASGRVARAVRVTPRPDENSGDHAWPCRDGAEPKSFRRVPSS